MKRLCLVFGSGLFALSSLGCGVTDDDTGPLGDDEMADMDTGTSTDTEVGSESTESGSGETTTETGVEAIGSLVGVVLDPQGAPLPTPGIQFCGPIDDMGSVESCIPVTVDGQGNFALDVLKVGLWNFKAVHGPVDGRYFGGQAFQLEFSEGTELDLGTVIVPEVATITDLSQAVGPVEVQIDSVLSIIIDPALAQDPGFVAPTELGGIEVASEYWQISDVEGSPILAAWSFSPFGVKATEGSFDLELATAFDLAAGETIKLWEVVKDNGEIHQVGEGTVNGDASAIELTEVGEGLHQLSWLLVTQ